MLGRRERAEDLGVGGWIVDERVGLGAVDECVGLGCGFVAFDRLGMVFEKRGVFLRIRLGRGE